MADIVMFSRKYSVLFVVLFFWSAYDFLSLNLNGGPQKWALHYKRLRTPALYNYVLHKVLQCFCLGTNGKQMKIAQIWHC